MYKKYPGLLAIVIGIVIIIAISLTPSTQIGGDRDFHGCLLPAGYSFDQDVQACARSWELSETQKQSAKIAVDHVGPTYGLTVLDVEVYRCPGCFKVYLERGVDRIEVCLEKWIITTVSLTPDECTSQGGRLVNILGGDTCLDTEENIGDVTGLFSRNICCVPISQSQISYDEARTIAQNSECVLEGPLKDTYIYNEFTKTWWIDLDASRPSCTNPACVVFEETLTAEINWRCTGALPG